MKRVIALAMADLRNIRRETMLLAAVFGPVLLALVIRFGIPWVDSVFLQGLHFQLRDHRILILSLLTLLTPLILGMLMGFIILDERDAQILHYFSITPLAKDGYLAYRLAGPAIMSFVSSFIALMLAGSAGLHLPSLIPVVLPASLEAPMMALFMGAFANNKVEGLTLSKAGGLLFIGPVIGYFVHSPWQLLAGILPSYWVFKAFLATGAPVGSEVGGATTAYWMYITAGALLHVALIYLLVRRFARRAG